MDVNGTKLHLLLGRGDWQAALVPPVDDDVCFDERAHTIGLRPRPFVFPTGVGAVRLAPADRRGVGADRFGNVFSIGEDRRTIRLAGAGRSTPFTWWPDPSAEAPGPTEGQAPTFQVCALPDLTGAELSGLAVTDEQYLVVGVRCDDASGARTGLLAFDLPGGGPPVARWWSRSLTVRPFDIASLPGGGVVVLDVTDPEAPGPAWLWTLDQHLDVVDVSGTLEEPEATPLFGPLEEQAAPSADLPVASPGPRAVPLSRATAAAAVALPLGWPTAVDAMPDGSVLVLDRLGPEGRFELSRWRCSVQLPWGGVRDSAEDDPARAFVCRDQGAQTADALADAVGHDLVVVPADPAGADPDRVFVVDHRGDQAFELLVDEDGADLVADYHPLRLFGGRGLVLAAGTPSYDVGDRWYPVPRQPVHRFAREARMVLAPPVDDGRGFDGGTPGTVWHRLVLDAVLPPGTSIKVDSRADDDIAALEHRDWREEPTPYLRGDGSEVPYHAFGPGSGSGAAAGCAGQGSWEVLFQSAVGRFVQLRLTLRGDGRQSPRIWAVRVHFPRFSYLEEYLPAIYLEDRESASFLDRYLANVEGLYTTLEGKVTAVQRLVDPTTLDAGFLPWLASWVGATVDPDWEPARVRLLVRHAARMYTRRGTKSGLVEAIRLATHPCPSDRIFEPGYTGDPFDVRVVESFQTRSVPGVVFGNPLDHAGPRLAAAAKGRRWEPPDGGALLTLRWRDFLEARHGVAVPLASFPPLTPTAAADAADWHDFVRGQLAPTYADVGSPVDLAVYQEHLAQRYGRFEDYLAAWGLPATGGRFEDIAFPSTLPPDGPPLQDWLMFVSAVLPARRSAHRATVLVPIRFDDSDEERAARLGRVRRVVEAARPAHSLVDVQPFWAALRVGEARVGLETIVGEGSRYVDLVLGHGRLARSTVPGGDTWRLHDRLVVGRDRVEGSVEPPARKGGRP